ncbi:MULTISPECIES: hypothetical protein [Staphylococcus]|uniref:hypothetical protein n=1 Tax=Staphylococcus TaxID=1279 RepID=UPI001BE6182F|nr:MULTISPECIES: hypothetical protein [Staphylococcus]MBT2852356.1 hypothetical protein [Staphylococcus coagulans]MBT2860497.1 hypothetical protein [Staphylococcus coagulans]MBU3873187.1 hypothetical protein [Staphylococcus coagulans]UXR54369.1 hypothetical protein MUA46_08875 [Staphylococcus schleiferi]UXR61274.1 hypothetical protein MUA72_08845 [Staphylococcus schleiferi]
MSKKTRLNVTETPVTNKFVDDKGNEVTHYKFPNGLEVQIVSDGKSKIVSGNYELKKTETENEIVITPNMDKKDCSFKSLMS